MVSAIPYPYGAHYPENNTNPVQTESTPGTKGNYEHIDKFSFLASNSEDVITWIGYCKL